MYCASYIWLKWLIKSFLTDYWRDIWFCLIIHCLIQATNHAKGLLGAGFWTPTYTQVCVIEASPGFAWTSWNVSTRKLDTSYRHTSTANSSGEASSWCGQSMPKIPTPFLSRKLTPLCQHWTTGSNIARKSGKCTFDCRWPFNSSSTGQLVMTSSSTIISLNYHAKKHLVLLSSIRSTWSPTVCSYHHSVLDL